MNPAELAQPFAEVLMLNGTLDSDYSEEFETHQLAVLESLANQKNMLDQKYFVYANVTYVTPDVPGTERPKWRTEELGFQGNLLSYSALRTPRTLGYGSVRAVCLTFKDVLLIPDLTDEIAREIPPFETSELLIHVPPHAVEAIGKLAA